MTRVDGGIVSQVSQFPGDKGRIAVSGVWSGGRWTPGTDLLVQHYREKLLLGVWRVTGIEIMSRAAKSPLLLLLPVRQSVSPQEDDIFVFDNGVYSILPISETDLPVRSSSAVELGGNRYHAVAKVGQVSVNEIIVFHEPEAAIDRTASQPVWWRGKQYVAKVAEPELQIEFQYPVELYLNHHDISVRQVIETLQPIRAFALDAGQEMFFREQRSPGGKRLSQTYQYFDPLITVDVGSVKLRVHPARPRQMLLLLKTEEPLRLMVSVLAAASNGHAESVTRLLLESVFSVDELLKRVHMLANIAVRFGNFTLRSPDWPDGFQINANTEQVIRGCLGRLEIRTLQRQGLLYGLDLIRRWCRILIQGDENQEDWTLKFHESLTDSVRGNVPRPVIVVFETKSLPNMVKGTGTLLKIQQDEQA